MEQQEQGQAVQEGQNPTQGVEGAQGRTEGQEKTLTQTEVNRIMGGVRDDASDTILKDLGYKDLDSLKADVGSLQEQREAAKSDLDKARESTSTLKAENDQLYARIAETEMKSSLRDSLAEAGVNPQRIQAAMRLADLDALDIDDEGKVTGTEEQIQAIQEAAPEFFGNTSIRRAPDLTGPPQSRPKTPEDGQAQHLMRALGLG